MKTTENSIILFLKIISSNIIEILFLKYICLSSIFDLNQVILQIGKVT